MEKCFLYLRQSSGASEADESLSITVQEEECLKLAKAKGLHVVDTFKEANRSGRLYPSGFEGLAAIDKVYQNFVRGTAKENQTRDALGRLLKRLDEVDYIIVIDITRLFRPLNGSFLENLVIQQLTEHNVRIWSCKENLIDFASFQSKLFTGLTTQLASEQLLIQREKSKKGMAKLKASGEWNFQCFASFGYRATGRKREIEIVEHRAEAVKLIYKLFLEGKKYYVIAKEVAPLLKDDPKCDCLYKTQMMRILKNPIYAGYYPLADGTLTKAKAMEGKTIISFADWQRVQDMFKARGKGKFREIKNFLPLSGKFVCGYCGHSINAITTNKTNVHMRCMSYTKRTTESCQNGVTWYTIEQGGVGLFDALYPLSMVWLVSQLSTSKAMQDEKYEQVKIELSNCEQKLKKLQEMWMKDLLTQEMFEKSATELKAKRDELEAELRKMTSTVEGNASVEEARVLLNKAMAKTMDRGECELALRSSIDKVTIWKDKIDIRLSDSNMFTLPIRRIFKSRELPLPWVDIKKMKDGSMTYEIVYSYKRMSPEMKKKAKTVYVHPTGKLTVKLDD